MKRHISVYLLAQGSRITACRMLINSAPNIAGQLLAVFTDWNAAKMYQDAALTRTIAIELLEFDSGRTRLGTINVTNPQ